MDSFITLFRKLRFISMVTLLATQLFSCNTVIEKQPMPEIKKTAKWGQTPILNLTEIPHAGKRVSAILNTHLHKKGLTTIKSFTIKRSKPYHSVEELEEKINKESIRWAKKHKISYLLMGSVDEWRYKYGIHGEPTVGISLKIIDVKSSQTLWSSSGAKTGRSNQNLAGVTNKLIDEILVDFSL